MHVRTIPLPLRVNTCSVLVGLLSWVGSSLLWADTATVAAESPAVQVAFRAWLNTPAAANAHAYLSDLQHHTRQPLSLFELTYNRHPAPVDCPYALFAIPPKTQWKNLVPALHILDQLHDQHLIKTFRIISVYRDPIANRCVQGSKKSQHLLHHAIDFQVPPDRPNASISTAAQLCQFWKTQGRALNLGLGVYDQNRFHIDGSGYRTWGLDHRRASSPCS